MEDTHTYSLVSLMGRDPDLADRLKRVTEEVRKTKSTLLNTAKSYEEKYRDEVLDGTRKRAKLLAEGETHGLTEAEIMTSYGQFLPTIQTPILNFLFFMFREESNNDQRQLENLVKQYIQEYGYENVVKALQDGADIGLEERTTLEDVLSKDVNTPIDMTDYIYGSMTHDMFVKIKKLKALSKSPNEREAFLAYRKCLELCEKYGIEFDKVPCKIKS